MRVRVLLNECRRLLMNLEGIIGASAAAMTRAMPSQRNAARAQATCSWNWIPVVGGMSGFPMSGKFLGRAVSGTFVAARRGDEGLAPRTGFEPVLPG